MTGEERDRAEHEAALQKFGGRQPLIRKAGEPSPRMFLKNRFNLCRRPKTFREKQEASWGWRT